MTPNCFTPLEHIPVLPQSLVDFVNCDDYIFSESKSDEGLYLLPADVASARYSEPVWLLSQAALFLCYRTYYRMGDIVAERLLTQVKLIGKYRRGFALRNRELLADFRNHLRHRVAAQGA